jgi:hypothetical protein
VFGVATVVQADIPDSGVIHGCYGKPGTPQKGQLRVRDASQGEQCRFYENTLDWNAQGVSGATGPTGPTGPSSNYFLAYGPDVAIAAGAAVSASVTCPAGMDAVAGGSVNNFGGAYANVQVNDSAPFPAIQSGSITPSNRYDVESFNESGAPQTVRAWALCVPAGFVTSGNQPALKPAGSPTAGRTP